MARLTKQAAKPKAVPAVVARLEDMLELAKQGGVRSVAIAYVVPESPFLKSTSAFADNDALGVKLLSAATAEMQHALLNALTRG